MWAKAKTIKASGNGPIAIHLAPGAEETTVEVSGNVDPVVVRTSLLEPASLLQKVTVTGRLPPNSAGVVVYGCAKSAMRCEVTAGDKPACSVVQECTKSAAYAKLAVLSVVNSDDPCSVPM